MFFVVREQVGLDRETSTTRNGLARASGRGAQRLQARQRTRQASNDRSRKEREAEQRRQEQIRTAQTSSRTYGAQQLIAGGDRALAAARIESTIRSLQDTNVARRARRGDRDEVYRENRMAISRLQNTLSTVRSGSGELSVSEAQRIVAARFPRDRSSEHRIAALRGLGQQDRAYEVQQRAFAAQQRSEQTTRAMREAGFEGTPQEFRQFQQAQTQQARQDQRDDFLLSGRSRDASPEQIRAAQERAIRSGRATTQDGRPVGVVGDLAFSVQTPQEADALRRQEIQRLADTGRANISLVGGGVGLAQAPSELVSSPATPSRQISGFVDPAPGVGADRFDLVGLSERTRLIRARAGQQVQRAGGVFDAPRAFGTQVATSAALPFIDTAALVQSFARSPRQTASLVGQSLQEGAVVGGQVLLGRRQLTGVTRVLTQEPGRAIGAVGGELAFFRGSGTAISGVRRGVEVGSTVLDPRFVMRRSEPGSLGRFDVPVRTAGVSTVPVRVAGAIGSPSLPRMTLREQVGFEGRTINAVSGARDLFGTVTRREIPVRKDLPTPDTPPLERAFFADPLGRIRPTRLGIVDQPSAGLADIISGDVTFRRTRPQAIVFPQQVVEPLPPPLRDVRQQLSRGRPLSPRQETRFSNWLLSPGTRFRPVGFISPEPEVILPPGAVITRERVAGVGLIEGRRVPFIEASIRQADTAPISSVVLGGDMLAARTRGLRVASRPIDARPRISLAPLVQRAIPRRPVTARPPRAPSPRIAPPRSLAPRTLAPRLPRAPSPRIAPPRGLAPRALTPRAPRPTSPRIGPRIGRPRSPGPRTPRQLMPRLPRPRAARRVGDFEQRRRTSETISGFEDYTPSFVAVDQKIFGDVPTDRGGFTGLELRPVVARRRN